MRHVFDILSKMCIFWLIFWTMFKKWSSNVHLCAINVSNNSSYLRLLSWSSPTFICRTLSDLLKIRDFLLLAFKYLFWNNVKTVKMSFSNLLNTRPIFAVRRGKICRGKVRRGTVRRRTVRIPLIFVMQIVQKCFYNWNIFHCFIVYCQYSVCQ